MPRADEVERSVEQLSALERRGLCDSVDRFQRAVNLQLVCRDFFVAQCAGVGCLDDQTANVIEQVTDLAQGAVGGADDLAGASRVADRFAQACDFAAEGLAGNQAGRVIGAGVDTETSAQSGQGGLQITIARLQSVLCNQRRYVGVDACHDESPSRLNRGRSNASGRDGPGRPEQTQPTIDCRLNSSIVSSGIGTPNPPTLCEKHACLRDPEPNNWRIPQRQQAFALCYRRQIQREGQFSREKRSSRQKTADLCPRRAKRMIKDRWQDRPISQAPTDQLKPYDGLPGPSRLSNRTMDFQVRRAYQTVRWTSKSVAPIKPYDGLPSPSRLSNRTMDFQVHRAYQVDGLGSPSYGFGSVEASTVVGLAGC